jgi:hypothetical protein
VGYYNCSVAAENLVDDRKINRYRRPNGNLVAQGMRKLEARTASRRHPQGTFFQTQGPPQLNDSSLQNGMSIQRASDLMSQHPNMPPGLFLRPYQAHLPVKLFGFIFQKQLPRLDTEQVGDYVDEHQRRRAGDDGRRDLGDGHDHRDGLGVRGESPEVYEVGRPAEHYEGAELDEDPSVGEEGGLLDEVDELQRDGEVGEGYEEVGYVLVLDEQLVGRPQRLDAVASLHPRSFISAASAVTAFPQLQSASTTGWGEPGNRTAAGGLRGMEGRKRR